MKTSSPKNVGEYIALAPKATQGKLKQLRAIIKKAAPTATERLSYGMPYYAYHGRLVYFRINKAHIGVYIPTPTLDEHKTELKQYQTGKATLRFPLDQKLPVTLITKLIKARMKKNTAKEV